MKRISVNSSNLKSVGYDRENSILEVEFNNNGIYFYKNVPEKTFVELLNVQSKGVYFNQYIKTGFAFQKGEYIPQPKPIEGIVLQDVQKPVQKPKNLGGRPTKIDEGTVKKLEAAFYLGWSDVEACKQAGISRQTFYDHMKNNKEFSDRITAAKQQMLISATGRIMDILTDKDADERTVAKVAMWAAERKDPEGFGKPVVNIAVQNNQQNNYYYQNADELEADMLKSLAEDEVQAKAQNTN